LYRRGRDLSQDRRLLSPSIGAAAALIDAQAAALEQTPHDGDPCAAQLSWRQRKKGDDLSYVANRMRAATRRMSAGRSVARLAMIASTSTHVGPDGNVSRS
jgi:hypothetical protein